jgi:biopolymer transport protein ExbD
MGAAVIQSGEATEPMMDINTTPLIDVMLVLLIMLIITIPVQTHAVKIDLPQASTSPPPIDPQRNKIAIDQNGTIFWNGTPVERDQLRTYLDLANQNNPPPELQIQPHPEARYEVVDEVLTIIKHANVQAMGFVGNENYQNF